MTTSVDYCSDAPNPCMHYFRRRWITGVITDNAGEDRREPDVEE